MHVQDRWEGNEIGTPVSMEPLLGIPPLLRYWVSNLPPLPGGDNVWRGV